MPPTLLDRTTGRLDRRVDALRAPTRKRSSGYLSFNLVIASNVTPCRPSGRVFLPNHKARLQFHTSHAQPTLSSEPPCVVPTFPPMLDLIPKFVSIPAVIQV